ncbi:MAG: hypothetical protein AB1488_08605 [Nitrospirota bacterium]
MKKINLFIFIGLLLLALIVTTSVWSGRNTLSDISIHIDTESPDVYAKLLLIDSQSKKTGYDPSIGSEVSQIPQSQSFTEGIDDDMTGERGVEGYNVIVGDPLAGNYTLQVIGNMTSLYTLSIYTSDTSGKSQRINLKGITTPNIISEFKIHYDPTPGAKPTVVRVATIQSTKQDVTLSYNVGWITNAGIVKSLLAKLDAAESALNRGQKKTTANQLNAFINEVKAQSTFHIKPECAEMLIEDAEYILKHL